MKRIQRSFSGGELSPFVYPLTDLKKRVNGLAKSKNGIVRRFGTWENRPGTRFVVKFPGRIRMALYRDHIYEQFTLFAFDPAYDNNNPIGVTRENGSREVQSFSIERRSMGSARFVQAEKQLIRTNPFHAPLTYERSPDTFSPYLILGLSRSPPSSGITNFTVNPKNLGSGDDFISREYNFALVAIQPNGKSTAPVYSSSAAANTKIRAPGQEGQQFAFGATIPSGASYPKYKIYFSVGGIYFLLAIVEDITKYLYIGEPVDTSETLPYQNQNVGFRWWQKLRSGSGLFGAKVAISVSLVRGPGGSLAIERNESLEDQFSQGDGPFTLYTGAFDEIDGIIVTMGYASGQIRTGYFTIPLVDFLTKGSIPAPSGLNEGDSQTAIITSTENFPGKAFFFGQRLLLASTLGQPGKLWVSRLGESANFSRYPVLTDDSSYDIELASNDSAPIEHLAGLRELVLFKGGSEWSLGNDLTPQGITPAPQSYYGAGAVPPIGTENSIIFIQGENVVRDFGYNFQSSGYRGGDQTLFASHLFEGRKIVSMALQRHPDPVLWCVNDDGTVRSLTYYREQNIFAWSQHDFGRKGVEVVTASEAGVSHVYFQFEEEDGSVSVEKLSTIDRTDFYDFKFMDSHKYYDMRNKDPKRFITLNSTATVDSYSNRDETLTITLTDHQFEDTPKFVDLFTDKDRIRLTVTGVETEKVKFTVRVDDLVQEVFQNKATTDWVVPVNEVDGLEHLNDKEVAVFADGSVISSPNNPDARHLQVVAGKVALGGYYSVICVGLPYVSDMKTLPIDLRGDDSVIDQNMIVNNIALYVHNTRGLFIGSEEPEDKTSTVGLVGLKTNFDGEPEIRPENGIVRKVINGSWNNQGEIIVRQIDPLPMNLQGILVTGDLVKEGN